MANGARAAGAKIDVIRVSELASEKVPPASRYKLTNQRRSPHDVVPSRDDRSQVVSVVQRQSSFDDVTDDSFCSESMLRGTDGSCWVSVDELDRMRYLGGYVADIPQ